MSSIDQAFVKAFSRRNRGESPRQQPSPQPVELTVVAEPGSLKVDPSVAQSASVWVDPVENEIVRADSSDAVVPKPHVAPGDTHVSVSSVSSDSEMDERIESLQHVHTSFASGAVSQEVADSLQIPVIVDEEPVAPLAPHAPIVETRIDPPVSRTQIPSPPSRKESPAVEEPAPAVEAPTVEEPAFEEPAIEVPALEEPVVQQPAFEELPVEEIAGEPEIQPIAADTIAPLSSTPPSPPASTPLPIDTAPAPPFRAAWEVDVFDVPNTVADLFFEGQLFQQIAERMLDAVSTGLSNMLVTSVNPGEGRSSVAIGIAMAAAAAGVRVALVDGDGDDPTLADTLRLDLEQGWTETTRNGLPIKEVAVHAVEDGVTLFPLMRPAHLDEAATADESMQLMTLLNDRFDLVIVDGPAGKSPKLGLWAEAFDSAVIVCNPNRTAAESIREVADRLEQAGIQGIGLVENFA